MITVDQLLDQLVQQEGWEPDWNDVVARSELAATGRTRRRTGWLVLAAAAVVAVLVPLVAALEPSDTATLTRY